MQNHFNAETTKFLENIIHATELDLDYANTIKACLAQGADPNHLTTNLAPLLIAVCESPFRSPEQKLTIMRILLEGGANPNLLTGDWSTFSVLHAICKENRNKEHPIDTKCAKAMLKLLFKHHADPNIPNKNGKTPIFFTENLEIMQLFIQNKADVNVIATNISFGENSAYSNTRLCELIHNSSWIKQSLLMILSGAKINTSHFIYDTYYAEKLDKNGAKLLNALIQLIKCLVKLDTKDYLFYINNIKNEIIFNNNTQILTFFMVQKQIKKVTPELTFPKGIQYYIGKLSCNFANKLENINSENLEKILIKYTKEIEKELEKEKSQENKSENNPKKCIIF